MSRTPLTARYDVCGDGGELVYCFNGNSVGICRSCGILTLDCKHGCTLSWWTQQPRLLAPALVLVLEASRDKRIT